MPGEPLPPDLRTGRFEGREEFRGLVRQAMATAAREGWREIILSDASFDDWPLAERAVTESLQAWAGSNRRFVILAKRYDGVIRNQARFVTWRKAWSHIVEARACADADPLELPSAILGPAWVMERRDLQWCKGHCGGEPERRLAVSERLQEWLHKSTPAFPATTLGL